MKTNCVVFGWNRAVPGRESTTGQLFQSFVEYLGAQQRAGSIQSFDIVFVEPHGGSLNGFFLIRGEPEKLDALTATEEWTRQQTKAIVNLDGIALLRGVTGPAVNERMRMWMEEIPRG